MKKLGMAIFAAAVFVGAAPALAITIGVGGASVSIGGGSGAGTTASATLGGTTATATLGDGNVATVGIDGVAGNSASAAITTQGGPLINVDQGDNSTDGVVNLGFDGLPAGDTVDGAIDGVADTIGALFAGIDVDLGGATPDTVGDGFASLSASERKLVMNRCVRILASPDSFSGEVVALCRKIALL